MFGNWGTLSLPGSDSLPPTAIKKYTGPLTFPRLSPSSSQTDPTFTPPPGEHSFYGFISKIRRATDVTRQHLEALNIRVEYDVPIEDIVGGSGTQEQKREFIPGEEDKIWMEREKELLIGNDVANEVLAKTRRDVKLGHMYRFFQSVEMVRVYYGTPEECAAAAAAASKDQEQKTDKPQENRVDAEDKMEVDLPLEETSNNNGKRPAAELAVGTEKRGRSTPSPSPPSATTAPVEDSEKKKDKFSIPERFREDLVRSFIEPLCWGYNVRIYPPRVAPKLAIQCSKFNLFLSAHLHLTPTIPAEARAGIALGPVAALQVRYEHSFLALADVASALRKRRRRLLAAATPPTPEEEEARRKKAEKEAKEKARQERHAKRRAAVGAKEEGSGKEDGGERPIEGEVKELPEELGDEGILVLSPEGNADDVLGVTREVAAILGIAQDRAKERKGIEEKKVRFTAVGKERDGDGGYWDDIYLFTTIHHHISITHARVSAPYLRFLRTGRLPSSQHEFVKKGGWEKVVLKKSRYWSLLVPEERRDAARAVSTVLRWCTRKAE